MDFVKKAILIFSFAIFLSGFFITPVHAAKLLLSPSSGTFTVGSTFDVSIFLNTEGKSVNTVSAMLSFPADKLQLVSPTIGQSVISVWTAQPMFDNQTGLVKLTGGMPGGINVQSGLITSLTFRVKQIGNSTLVKFSDESRVLANDGNGTDILSSVQNGAYNLILPPPAGPIVSSKTHSDQSKWYSNKNVILSWNGSSIGSYSYILDQDPAGSPDDISEGSKTTLTYKDLSDGTYYFHIKSLRDGVWGGVTSFGINIDTEPPAEFLPELTPSNWTSSKNQIVNFQTSDVSSGVSYYEIKTVPLSPKLPVSKSDNNLFIEATSPYQLSLDIGKYDIILRSYDKAGNYREVISRLNVVTPIFGIIGNAGIKIGGLFIEWFWFWIILSILVLILWYIALRTKKWHHGFILPKDGKKLPSDVESQLETLKKYRKKYGNLVLLIIVVGSLFFQGSANAQQVQQIQLSPPIISLVSRNISNEEIFYVGGKTDSSGITVVIYLQNAQTGETFSDNVSSDTKGNWFYRYPTFLASGDYLLWTQSKLDENLSPPSPQIQMTVQKTAIQFGASRLSYEIIYLILAAAFLLVIIGLIVFIIYHARQGRKKHKLFFKEIYEAEESIRRGFAVLRRDIEAELAVLRKANLSGLISEEAKQKESHLLEDLNAIQKYITKEVWDVEQTEHFG